jgi:hypothetical protein
LPERRREALGDQAPEDVGAAARREREDHPERPRWPRLGLCVQGAAKHSQERKQDPKLQFTSGITIG